MTKRMVWKRRYTAEIPDPLSWSLVDRRGDWLLYRAHELLEGWRNYRLIHRHPMSSRVSFRVAWHSTELRFATGRDHKYLAINRPALVYWLKAVAETEPDPAQT